MASMLKLQRAGARDRGSALVVAVIISVIVFSLSGLLLALVSHESSASNVDRRRQQAIDAAFAGLVVANSALTRNSAFATTGLLPFTGGSAEFEVTITADPASTTGFGRLITSVGYAPSKAAVTRSTRSVVQVVELEPIGFTYGVFSETDISMGSSSTVIGDIYTNQDVKLGNSQDYIGSIYARGDVVTGSNQKITGTVYANGDIVIGSSSSTLYGSAFAGGDISTGGTIRDTAQAGGTIGCTKVLGACIPHSPPPPVPVQHLPAFVWNPANYASVTTYATGAAFVSTHSKVNTQGTFYVTGNVSFAKQDELRLTGDMTIVATGSIALPGSVVNKAAGAAKVQLTVISAGGGGITPANNFTIPSSVTTLLYTTGTFDAKNSSTFRGVLYAGGVTSGAHISVTHELLTAPGFNWAPASPQAFTIRNISTRETSGG
jgi:Tfp pilus assembly protein PilX